ncbi:MAG TPA: hypothetical protein VGO40_02040 [Longimicrobium sp.]|jgi:hypothetical protein|nr:hypothetical protein [Longimicrobium sp.]
MIRAVRVAGCGVVLAAAVLAAGCKQRDDGGATNLGPVHVDTANNTPMDGVSDEQLKRQAQALTPEEAAARGVAIDTTIHVENLGSPDTVRIDGAPTDTATKAAGTSAAPATKP